MKFSVLITTFNSELPKLFCTLQSVLLQKFDDFEIVISDDASKKNYFEEIEHYFEEKGFSNFHLVGHEENKGTVKNLMSGLEQVSGKYVKLLSPGDTFYNGDTMKKLYQFMEGIQSEYCYGLLQGYQMEQDGKIKKIDFFHPFDIQSYRKRNEKKIVKNLVLYSDNVCGVAVCGKKDFFVEYLNKICNDVVYEEDIMQVLSAVESRPIDFFDDYISWYETGVGISSGKNKEFVKLLAEDVSRFYKMLYREYGDGKYGKYIRKRHQLSGVYRVRNLYLRTFLRFFVNPDSLRYFTSSMCQRMLKLHYPKSKEIGFLEQSDYWEMLHRSLCADQRK